MGRGRHDPKVFRLTDGRWGCHVELPRGVDGKRRRKFVTGQSRAVVIEKRNDELHKLAVGVVPGERVTVWEWVEHYLDSRKQTIAGSTYDNYRNVAMKHIHGSTVGGVLITQLTTRSVEAFLAQKREQRLSATTVNRIRLVLNSAMQRAVEQRLVVANVIRATRPHQLAESHRRAMSEEQAKAFSVQTRGTRYEAAYGLMLTCGLRPGECFGLRWSDIDMHARTLTVRRTLRRDGTIGPTKTRSSRRTLSLPEYLLPMLRDRRERQEMDRLAAPQWASGDDPLVFTTRHGTPLNLRNVALRDFQPLCVKAGIGSDWVLHELRHTAATLMLLRAIPIEQVSRVLGHSSIRVTSDTYAHILPRHLEPVADAMEALFGP